MKIFMKKVLFPILVFSLVFILIAYCTTDYTTKDVQTNYILKSYKNTVALYDNDEIVKIYSDIVLNTLPKNDIQIFNSGISVPTPTHADQYLENFD